MLAGVLLAVGAALSAASASAGTYVFESVVDSSGGFAGFQNVALNDNGQVAFHASLDDGSAGYFRSESDGSLTTIATTGPVFSQFNAAFRLSVNNSGEVAFLADLVGGGKGVFKGSGGAITTIGSTATGLTTTGVSTAINDAGVVAFSGSLAGGTEAFVGDGGPLTSIASPAFGRPNINDAGQVSFFAGGAMVSSDGVTTTTLADRTGIVDGFFLNGGLNSAGVASFTARPAGLPADKGIYLSDGQGVTEVATSADGFTFIGVSDLNDRGDVVFAGASVAGSGVFTGADPVSDRVIGSGQSLFGLNLSMVLFDVGGLNANGDIAFAYRAGQVQGVAVARFVPEPDASLLLGLAGALGLAIRGSRTPARGR